MFFEYKNLLEKNNKYYLDKYGISPGFKAGMEVGVVTVSEIGDIKREIAYHGDVLNTAARLQELCKTYKSQLLISRNLNDVLGKGNGYVSKPVGKLKLRGKNIELQVFSIEFK
jgi:adenylate cyclase